MWELVWGIDLMDCPLLPFGKYADFITRATKFIKMKATMKRRVRVKSNVSNRKVLTNGHIHTISPATASEIRSLLGIQDFHIKRVLRAFHAAGVKVYPIAMRTGKALRNRSVFLNIPFDETYEPFFVALICSLVALRRIPRCVLEISETGEGTLKRIFELIRSCPVSIHDLSRVGLPARFIYSDFW